MKEPSSEALRWLRQAENDLAFARVGLCEGFYAQVRDKALKSIHYGKLAARIVFGHSLVELSAKLDLPEDLRKDLAVLDQYYIPTRYPNGLPGSTPYEVYNAEQAAAAVAVCDRVIALARDALP